MGNKEFETTRNHLLEKGKNFKYFDRLFAINEDNDTDPYETYNLIQNKGLSYNQKLIFERTDKKGFTLANIVNGCPTYERFEKIEELLKNI